MKNRSKGRSIAIFILAAAILLIVSAGVAQVRGITPFLATQPRTDLGSKATTVVATVNGEPITLGALETTRVVQQVARQQSDSSLETQYADALEYQIRETLLQQEAARRQVRVDDTLVDQQMAEMLRLEQENPEVSRFIQEQMEILGINREEYDRLAIETYREGTAAAQALAAIEAEAPLPGDTEIDAEVQRRLAAPMLTIMPVEFATLDEAADFLEEAAAATSAAGEGSAVGAFAEMASDQNSGADPILHETFPTGDALALPDYVQDALRKPVGSVELFERADGTAVVYMVLTRDDERAQAESAASLRQQIVMEHRAAYAEQEIDRLRAEAKLEVFTERIPTENSQLFLPAVQDNR